MNTGLSQTPASNERAVDMVDVAKTVFDQIVEESLNRNFNCSNLSSPQKSFCAMAESIHF